MLGVTAALPLLIGALLAVLALGFVLWPLWAEATGIHARSSRAQTLRANAQAQESPIDALREIEFDRATGKLSDEDYGSLRTRYTREALVEMRTADPSDAYAPDQRAVAPAELVMDAAEAFVRLQRARRRGCATCGPRPEPDAVFCSNCGRFLSDMCIVCEAPVENVAARFCTGCGTGFAA